jgi:hypothetical protein
MFSTESFLALLIQDSFSVEDHTFSIKKKNTQRLSLINLKFYYLFQEKQRPTMLLAHVNHNSYTRWYVE